MRSEGTGGRVRTAQARNVARRNLVIAICLASLACGGVWAASAGRRLWTAALALQSDVRELERLVAGGDVGLSGLEVAELLYTTRTDLIALEAASGPLLWLAPHLGWVPRYGPDIRAVPDLLEIGLSLTAAGEELVELLAPLLAEGRSNKEGATRELLAALQAARPQLAAALSAVEEAEAARGRLPEAGLSARVQGWVARLDRYLPMLEPGIRGALILPEVLGADAPRTYLVLIQNEDELRATGGFISGVARVTVQAGEVTELAFEDSYAVDDLSHPYPDAPLPLQEYMLSELWLFRDSNWSPDFPTSARQAAALYTISRDARIDGVIALDQQAIRLLIGALAPLEVEGQDEPITGENVIQVARQAWVPKEGVSGEWWIQRKGIMAAVLDAATRRLELGLDREAVLRMAGAALVALEERHLLVHVEDGEAAGLVSDLGWDGAVLQDTGDYLMVVDTNMGFNKVNALIQESIEYLADLTHLDEPRAALTLRHSHPLGPGGVACRHKPRYNATYEQMMERCYWDYVRVYVPAGSSLASATPHPVPGKALLSGQPSPAAVTTSPLEHGRTMMATFLLLRRGEMMETRFEYALPREVVHVTGSQATYVLTVQKQPGTQSVPVRIRILLPPGAVLRESEPRPETAAGSALEYALSLEVDQHLTVAFDLRR